MNDINFEFHCNKPNCGNDCIFAPEACTNEGCTVIYSRKWASRHDKGG